MTRQYNNSTTILCIYVLPVSSVGVYRHGLDTRWTGFDCATDTKTVSDCATDAAPGLCRTRIQESEFMNPASVIGNYGIRITERNFLKKYKKTPSFFVLVLVCSQWQIYTKGGNDRNDQNAWAIMPIAGHKNRRKIDGCKN